jgi:hypothetical protein
MRLTPVEDEERLDEDEVTLAETVLPEAEGEIDPRYRLIASGTLAEHPLRRQRTRLGADRRPPEPQRRLGQSPPDPRAGRARGGRPDPDRPPGIHLYGHRPALLMTREMAQVRWTDGKPPKYHCTIRLSAIMKVQL